MGIFDESSSALRLNVELWEYLLVVHPDEAVNEKLAEERNWFYKNYELSAPVLPGSHIPVANFLAKEELEATLVRWIQNICNLQTGFTVSLNNFSGFPPDTVYLRVQDARPFEKLAAALKLLDGFFQSNNCPPINLVTKPHLSIAGKLAPHIYEKAVRDYAHRSFHETFKVDRMVLLKRDAYMNCQVLNKFILPSPLT